MNGVATSARQEAERSKGFVGFNTELASDRNGEPSVLVWVWSSALTASNGCPWIDKAFGLVRDEEITEVHHLVREP